MSLSGIGDLAPNGIIRCPGCRDHLGLVEITALSDGSRQFLCMICSDVFAVAPGLPPRRAALPACACGERLPNQIAEAFREGETVFVCTKCGGAIKRLPPTHARPRLPKPTETILPIAPVRKHRKLDT